VALTRRIESGEQYVQLVKDGYRPHLRCCVQDDAIRMRRASLRCASLLTLIACFISPAHAAPPVDIIDVDLAPLIDAAVEQRNRFAIEVPHRISTAMQGEWTSSGSTSFWSYSVQIPSAVSMSFHASRLSLPSSAVLTVTGARAGATYRARDVNRGGLWSRPLAGDLLTFSLSVDTSQASKAQLQVETFQAGYRGLGGGVPDHPHYKGIASVKLATTTGCTENYSCNATPANQGPAQATVAVIVGNMYQCTGTLLNNTRGDGIPYVLTARHCENGELGGGAPGAAGSVTVYWDAITPCGATLGSIYDGGISWQSGAVTVLEQQDAWLIKLDAPPVASDAYYAGWDATGGMFTGGYSVHHALGYDKQYVGWYGQSLFQTIPAATLKIRYDSTFWGLVNGLGSVGAGASGGAVFDPSNHVVGTGSLAYLPNGANSAGVCPTVPPVVPSASTITAQYTALSGVWSATADSTSTTGTTTLQSVLDPDATGQRVLGGFGVLPMTLTVDQTDPRTDQSLTLSWNVAGAEACTATGGRPGDGWTGSMPASGSVKVTEVAGGQVSYSLSCTGGDRKGRAVANVSWIYIAPVVDLHTDPGPVMVGGTAYLFWFSNVTPCTAAGGVAGDGWAGTKAISGSQDIVATQIGVVTYTLTCGTGARTATTQLSVNVVPPSVTLYADATTLRAGSYVNLHWVGSGSGGSCASTGGSPGDNWNFAGNTGSTGSGIVSETTAGIYTYTFTCTGGGQSSSSSVTVVFTNDPQQISLTAMSPQQAIYSQSTFLDSGSPDLLWTSNVNGCFLTSSGPSGLGNTGVALQGQYPGGSAAAVQYIAGDYLYTLQCGALQATTTIDWTTANPTVALTAPTTTWVANQQYQLTWTTNTVPCTATGGVAGDGWAGVSTGVNGAVLVSESLPGNYTFSLHCGSGTSASQSQVTVTVPPPAVSINASPDTVVVGQPTRITWNSTVSPCTTIDGSGGVNWGGSLVYSSGSLANFQNASGTYTYSITCGSGSQTVHASTQATFTAPSPTTLSVSSSNVSVNTPVTLTWNSPGSAVCTATGGDGIDGWSGTQAPSGTVTVTSPTAATITYSISCNNGTAQAQVTYAAVLAGQAATPTPTPSLSVSASATSQVVGRSVTISWNSQNSNSCIASGGANGDGWSGSVALSGSMALTESTAGMITYSLTCTGATPAATAKVVVNFTDAAGSGSSGGGSGGGGTLDLLWLCLLSIGLLVRVIGASMV
jgi:lysyl endopeptidase